MLETKTREISGRHFRVTQMPGMKSLKIFTRITKLVGPAIGAMTKNDGELAALLESDVASLGGAIAMFCEDLDESEIEGIAEQLAKHSEVALQDNDTAFVELNEAIFDDTFGGRIDMLFGWIAFALEVNYSSFLDAKRLLSSRGSAKTPPDSQSASPQQSPAT